MQLSGTYPYTHRENIFKQKRKQIIIACVCRAFLHEEHLGKQSHHFMIIYQFTSLENPVRKKNI